MESLDIIAARLEGLEETIIHKFLDRAQFCRNEPAYRPGESGFDGAEGRSLFELRLHYHETMDALFGRFMVPEERPVGRDMPAPRRRVQLPDTGLAPVDFDEVSVAADLTKDYLAFLPKLCRPGDDGQYGSSVEHDVIAIQAVGRRVHYGALYVGEAKFRGDPDGYRSLAEAGNRGEIGRRLTRVEVEERILRRVRDKVDYVQGRINLEVRRRVDPDIVLQFYRETIIPLTKEGEIRYIMLRARHAVSPD